MPRQKRIEYEGAVYHCMCRGNNAQDIYLRDEGRRLWLASLDEVCEQTGWKIHAYVMMSNHYHLLLETPEANLVAGMKWFQGTYTQRFNAMFQRWGHLFQGRYKAIPVQGTSNPGYFKTISTYIHLNPFRAGLCGVGFNESLESYAWSSYSFYIGNKRKRPDWLVRKRTYKSWGLKEGERGTMSTYRANLERCMQLENGSEVGDADGIGKQIKHGWYIGNEEFMNKLLARMDGGGDNLRSAQRKAHGVKEAERLLKEGLKILGMTEQDVFPLKNTHTAKQSLAWLLKTHTTVSVVWIADRLHMGHRTNASRAISQFRTSDSRKDREWKKNMLQITG